MSSNENNGDPSNMDVESTSEGNEGPTRPKSAASNKAGKGNKATNLAKGAGNAAASGMAGNKGVEDLKSKKGLQRRAGHEVAGKVAGTKGKIANNAVHDLATSSKKQEARSLAEKGRSATKAEHVAAASREVGKVAADKAIDTAIVGATGGAGKAITPVTGKATGWVTSKVADSKAARVITESSTNAIKWIVGGIAAFFGMGAIILGLIFVLVLSSITGLAAAAQACAEKAENARSGGSIVLGEWDQARNGLEYNAKYVYLGLRAGGYSPAGAAGAVGNFQAESGINPWVQQGGPYGYSQKKPPSAPKPCPNVGTGIAQWGWQGSGSNCAGSKRFNALIDWAQKVGKDPWNLQTQVEWIFKESENYKGPNGGSFASYMGKVTDVGEAAFQFHRIYESSGDSRQAIEANRVAPAKKWYKKFKNLQPESNQTEKVAIKPPVYIVGDSLTAGSTTAIKKAYKKAGYPVTINAVTSRSTPNGIATLNSKAAKKAKTWIVALGTNDPQSTASYTELIKQVVKKAGSRQVLWFTIHRPHSQTKNTNKAIMTMAEKTINMGVIDYASAVRANKQYLSNDDVHLTAKGRDWRAKMYLPTTSVAKVTPAAQKVAASKAKGRWYLPVRKWQPFGTHDVRAMTGDPVYAMYYGTVTESKDLKGCDGRACNGGYYSYGRYISIKFKNSQKPPIIHAHLSKRFVQAGEQVVPGQIIGIAGGTGNTYGNPPDHLHLEFQGQGNGGNAPGWISNKTNTKPPQGSIPEGDGYDTSHDGTPETEGGLDEDGCENAGGGVPGQTEVGFDDCPVTVPKAYVRAGIKASKIKEICEDAVSGASSPEAAKAIIYALNQVGKATYAGTPNCGVGTGRRMDKGWYDCSSLVNRAFFEGAGLKGVRASDITTTMNNIDRKYWKQVSTKDMVPGDIAVYGGRTGAGAAGHVVLYLGDGMIVDTGACRDKVRVQKLMLPNHGNIAFSGAYRMVPNKAR